MINMENEGVRSMQEKNVKIYVTECSCSIHEETCKCWKRPKMKTGDSAVWFDSDELDLKNVKIKKEDLKTTTCTYAGKTKFKFDFNEYNPLKKEIKAGEIFYKDTFLSFPPYSYVFESIESFERCIKALEVVNKINELCKERSLYWNLEDANEVFDLLNKIDKRSKKR